MVEEARPLLSVFIMHAHTLDKRGHAGSKEEKKMDALLTLLGNVIKGLERDELRKVAYPTQNRYKFLM